jgi:hypothetical protein
MYAARIIRAVYTIIVSFQDGGFATTGKGSRHPEKKAGA